MNFFTVSLTNFFDFILKPFENLPAVYGLIFLSLISGILFLKLFGWLSLQKRIKKTKDKIKVHLLEVVLYRRDTILSLKAQVKMIGQSLVYLSHALIPFAILAIPCLILLGQLSLRYGLRSFQAEEEGIVNVHVEEGKPLNDFAISVTDGLKVLTPPLRINEKNEVHWRVKTLKDGAQTISIHHQNRKYDKQVQVNRQGVKLANGRYKSWFNFLLHPGEKRLGPESEVTSIEIKYPQVDYKIFRFQFHWLAIFFVVSLLGCLVFKRFLRVEI